MFLGVSVTRDLFASIIQTESIFLQVLDSMRVHFLSQMILISLDKCQQIKIISLIFLRDFSLFFFSINNTHEFTHSTVAHSHSQDIPVIREYSPNLDLNKTQQSLNNDTMLGDH